ncbi:hypothetical protein H6764_03450, partial [Candidatus Nomurabacteria bacterium]|nr:hypothetical protein [Candidatus Nomurabacteria bacterium]
MASTTVQNNPNTQDLRAGFPRSPEVAVYEYGLLPESIKAFVSEEFWNSLTIEQRVLVSDLESNKLPPQLQGTVPEAVWATLSPTQRFEFLIDSFKKGKSVVGNRAEAIISTPEVSDTEIQPEQEVSPEMKIESPV